MQKGGGPRPCPRADGRRLRESPHGPEDPRRPTPAPRDGCARAWARTRRRPPSPRSRIAARRRRRPTSPSPPTPRGAAPARRTGRTCLGTAPRRPGILAGPWRQTPKPGPRSRRMSRPSASPPRPRPRARAPRRVVRRPKAGSRRARKGLEVATAGRLRPGATRRTWRWRAGSRAARKSWLNLRGREGCPGGAKPRRATAAGDGPTPIPRTTEVDGPRGRAQCHPEVVERAARRPVPPRARADAESRRSVDRLRSADRRRAAGPAAHPESVASGRRLGRNEAGGQDAGRRGQVTTEVDAFSAFDEARFVFGSATTNSGIGVEEERGMERCVPGRPRREAPACGAGSALRVAVDGDAARERLRLCTIKM